MKPVCCARLLPARKSSHKWAIMDIRVKARRSSTNGFKPASLAWSKRFTFGPIVQSGRKASRVHQEPPSWQIRRQRSLQVAQGTAPEGKVLVLEGPEEVAAPATATIGTRVSSIKRCRPPCWAMMQYLRD